MNLQDKIIKLRRSHGLSQEELAERLGISRQAVSKWESGQSLPDIDKIILLSEFFGVTTDYLLKNSNNEDIEQENIFDKSENAEEENAEKLQEDFAEASISLSEANRHIALSKRMARIVAIAVFLLIISPILIITLPAFAVEGLINLSQDIATLIGILALFSFISLGVGLCIYSGFLSNDTALIGKKSFTLDVGVREEILKIYDEEKCRLRALTVIGTILCIISPVPIIVSAFIDEALGNGDFFVLLSVGILLLLVAIGVFLLTLMGMTDDGIRKLLSKPLNEKAKKRNRVYDILCECYWWLVVFAYLTISFVTGRWDLTWLIWLVSPIVPKLLSLIKRR